MDPASGVRHGNDLSAELLSLLGRIDRNVTRARNSNGLAFEAVIVAVEVFLNEVHEAIARCFGTSERTAIGKTLTGKNAFPDILDALVLTEHVADLTSAGSDITCRNVGVCADVAAELGHEGLAEAHDFVVGLALRIEVRTTFATAHRKRGERVLEDLLEAEELDDGEVHGRMQTDAALVGADAAVVLHAITAVDLHVSFVVYPRNAKHDNALGLDQALEQRCFLVFGVGFDDRLKRGKNLGNSLDEFGLVRVLLLDKLDDGLDVTHVTS